MITLEPTYERETIDGVFGRFSDLIEKTAKEAAKEERRLARERARKQRAALARYDKTGRLL
jgi:hypothetical protein